MWSTLELREIRVFLALAEELHFSRTADRLGITHSRVSQTIRTLEARVGGRLFDRTSRRVQLTALGERFRDEVSSPYRQLEHAFTGTRDAATGITGTLRLGLYAYLAGGPHLLEIIKTFERLHPHCTVHVVEPAIGGLLSRLRDDLDIIAVRMPVTDPDLVVGPVVSSEERVAVMAVGHPLAARSSISIEELAHYTTTDSAAAPRAIMDVFSPSCTPSGRPIHRANVNSLADAAVRAATGELIHPTVPSFLAAYPHPGLTSVPIRDLPPSTTALVWSRANDSPKVKAFAAAAAEIVHNRLGVGARLHVQISEADLPPAR
jgi:DNA-binding transcriptional LysR family regulator